MYTHMVAERSAYGFRDSFRALKLFGKGLRRAFNANQVKDTAVGKHAFSSKRTTNYRVSCFATSCSYQGDTD